MLRKSQCIIWYECSKRMSHMNMRIRNEISWIINIFSEIFNAFIIRISRRISRWISRTFAKIMQFRIIRSWCFISTAFHNSIIQRRRRCIRRLDVDCNRFWRFSLLLDALSSALSSASSSASSRASTSASSSASFSYWFEDFEFFELSSKFDWDVK